MNRSLRHLVCVAGFILLTAAMYPDVWLGRSDLYCNDLAYQNLPQRQVAAEIWRSGEIPLWNRYSFGGQPLLAAGQAGIFYPPNALFLLMHPNVAMNWSTLLHLALAGTLMYLYLLQLWRQPFPAWIGGAIFMTCGFLTGHVIHTQMLNAAVWIPLVLLFLERLRMEQRVRDAVGLAITLTLLILAGHPQMVYYTCLIGSAYAAFLRPGDRTERKRFLTLSGTALLLAGLLSALQIYPTYGLLQRSVRQALDFESFAFLPMTLDWLAALAAPFRNGGGSSGQPMPPLAWELTGYAGIVALMLGGVAALRLPRRDPHVGFFAVAGLVALLLALDDLTHASVLLYQIPMVNRFRIPARFILFFDLAVAVLAARSLCVLAKPGRVAVTGKAWWQAATHGGAGAWVCWPASAVLLLAVLAVDAARGPEGLSPQVWLVPGTCLVAALGVLWGFRSRPILRIALLGALVLADNTAYVRGFTGPLLQPAALARRETRPGAPGIPSWIAGMQKDPERCRIASFDAVFQANQPAEFRLEALNGYDALYPRLYADQAELMYYPVDLAPGALPPPLARSRVMLDLLNVRYVVAPLEVGLADVPAAEPTLQVAVNPDEPVHAVQFSYASLGQSNSQEPPASVTCIDQEGAQHATEFQEHVKLNEARKLQAIRIDYTGWHGALRIDEVRLLGAGGRVLARKQSLPVLGHPFHTWYRDGERGVYWNSAAYPRYWVAASPQDPRTRESTAEIQETVYRHREQSARVTSGGGWFVVSQLFDPGWTATVDGKRADVEELGGHLLGVRIPPGTHELRFRYEPREWTLGVRITALAIVALAAWVFWARRTHAW